MEIRNNPQLLHKLREFESNHVWIHENFETLFEQYAERWIGVKNRQVIASDVDLDALLSQLPEPGYTCVEFITCEPLEMVL
jgi:hypothetical protein